MQQCIKEERGCDGLNQASLEVAYLCVGGVTICTSQLTVICVIFASKYLTSPHANKHIRLPF